MHGTFELALDAQGRLHLPPAHREAIRGAAVDGEPVSLLAYVHGKGLVVLTSKVDFDAQHEALLAEGHGRHSIAVLRLFAQSVKCKLDKQGRIRLPSLLSKLSSIAPGESVVVTGGPGGIFIWSSERFETVGLGRPQEVDPS